MSEVDGLLRRRDSEGREMSTDLRGDVMKPPVGGGLVVKCDADVEGLRITVLLAAASLTSSWDSVGTIELDRVAELDESAEALADSRRRGLLGLILDMDWVVGVSITVSSCI